MKFEIFLYQHVVHMQQIIWVLTMMTFYMSCGCHLADTDKVTLT